MFATINGVASQGHAYDRDIIWRRVNSTFEPIQISVASAGVWATNRTHTAYRVGTHNNPASTGSGWIFLGELKMKMKIALY